MLARQRPGSAAVSCSQHRIEEGMPRGLPNVRS